MKLIQSAFALIGALVHPSAEHSAPKLAAHQAFLAEKLLFSAVALAAGPFYLVIHGAPSLTVAVVFALAILQIAAAMAVAQTGRLILGHVISACSFAGIAFVFAFHAIGSDTLSWSAVCAGWLGLAGLEAASSFNKRLFGTVCGVIAVAVGAMITLQIALATSRADAILVAGTALVATLAIGHRMIVLYDLASRRVARELARNRAMARALGNLTVGFDAHGLVDHASAECEALLGITRLDIAGRGLFEHVHVADRPAFLTLVADATHGTETQVAQLRLRSGIKHVNSTGQAEPRHVWVEMRAHRMAVEGKPVGAVAVLRDISADRQSSMEVDAARDSIDSAIRSKDEFLANMSHELRTPLNAIIGFSEMLGSQTMRPIEAEKQREYARIIHQSGQHLLAVVNSILDMSKIQSGTFSLLPEPFEIAPLLEQCCDMIHLRAEASSIEIVRDVPPGLEGLIGDRRACKQILINLLSNAVKFTPDRGQVTIRVRPEGTTLCITVADNGIGISTADIAKLGRPFFQAHGTIRRPYEGTGLGLSVVRGLLDLHGGSLSIDSEVGKGTSVVVRLPIDCRSVTQPASAAIDLDARRIGGGAPRHSEAPRAPAAKDILEPGLKLIA